MTMVFNFKQSMRQLRGAHICRAYQFHSLRQGSKLTNCSVHLPTCNGRSQRDSINRFGFHLQHFSFSEKPQIPEVLKSGQKLEDETKEARRVPMTWKTLVGVIILGTGVILSLRYFRATKKTTIREVSSTGKALIGGPFDLLDCDNQRITSETFKGSYVLLYFGFTFCPDICPAELHKMQSALADLRTMKGMPEVVPVFISIDPARDTVERLREYRTNWNPNIHWLTGPLDKIDEVAKAYRVYYSIPTEDEKMGDNDYLVDHSIFFYLLNPEGEFMEFFGKNLTAAEVTMKMAGALRKDIMDT